MSDMKVLLRPPRKTDRGTIYYLKPITSYHTNDTEKSGLSLYFEKPKVIVQQGCNSYYGEETNLFFNYHHPNREKLAEFKYGKDYYGKVCVGDLYSIMYMVDNPKYPLMLYNFFSTYNDGGGGYWSVANVQNCFPCVICGAKFARRKGDAGAGCCDLFDRYEDSLDISNITGKNPKFTWNKDLNGFIYKGKVYNE